MKYKTALKTIAVAVIIGIAATSCAAPSESTNVAEQQTTEAAPKSTDPDPAEQTGSENTNTAIQGQDVRQSTEAVMVQVQTPDGRTVTYPLARQDYDAVLAQDGMVPSNIPVLINAASKAGVIDHWQYLTALLEGNQELLMINSPLEAEARANDPATAPGVDQTEVVAMMERDFFDDLASDFAYHMKWFNDFGELALIAMLDLELADQLFEDGGATRETAVAVGDALWDLDQTTLAALGIDTSSLGWQALNRCQNLGDC